MEEVWITENTSFHRIWPCEGYICDLDGTALESNAFKLYIKPKDSPLKYTPTKEIATKGCHIRYRVYML